MRFRGRRLLLALLIVAGTAGCGQKGPLFLPGDPSQVNPSPAEEQREDDDEDDGEPR